MGEMVDMKSFMKDFRGALILSITLSLSLTNLASGDPYTPTAMPDNYLLDEDSTLSIPPSGVLENDSPPSNFPFYPLSAVLESGPDHGTLSLAADGSFIYTPNANYYGEDFFQYATTILAGQSMRESSPVTVRLVVDSVNDAPNAVDDSATTDEDDAVTIWVLRNDTDVEGDALSVTSAGTANGTATINDYNVVYTPALNFFGTNVLQYSISDGEATSFGQVTIVVNPINDAPVAVDDEVATDEDNAITIPVLANVSDAEGDRLTLIGVSDGTISGTNLVYAPAADWNGTNTLFYYVSDGEATSTGQVTIVVNSVNDAPNAVDDSATTDEDNAVTIPVLANDSDAEGDALSLTGAFTSNGTATLNETNVVYTPALNFFGTTVVDYYVSDGEATSTGQVTIVVNSINDAPVAVDDEVATDEDNAITIPVLANDSDAEGDSLSLTGASTTNGTATINDYNVVYTPELNFFGTNVLKYSISDGEATSIGQVTIVVNSVNDAPNAVDDSATTDEDIAVTIPVLANDSDVEGHSLSLTGAFTSNGTATLNETNVVYTPALNFFGTTVVDYYVSDGEATSTGQVTIVVNSINDAPVAVDDEVATDEDNAITIPVLANVSDAEGDRLTLIGVSDGTISGTNLVYAPAADWNGTNTLFYYVSDGEATSTGQVTIVVNSVNDAPNAVDDSATTDEDIAVTIPVLANDSDVEGHSLSLTGAFTSNGTATLNETNVVYTPALNFFGTTVVDYYVSDGEATSTGQVTIVVNSINDAPIAVDDEVATDEDNAITIPVLANVSDAEGDRLTLIGVSDGTISGTNLVYAPAADWNGTNTLFYYVSDGEATSTGQVTIVVNSINDAPVAVDDEVATDEDNAITIPVLANVSDAEGDRLTLIGVSDGTMSGTNLVYAPAADWNGTNTLFYYVSDGEATSTGQVTIVVNSINDAPVAVDDSAATEEDVAITIPVLANDSDVESDGLTLINVSDGVVSGGTHLVYTPPLNFFGTNVVDYYVSDGEATSTGQVTIVVNSINDAPVAVDDEVATDEDNAITIPVLANVSDAEGDRLTLIGVSDGTMSGTNLVYAPAADWNGTNTLFYYVSDGEATSTGQVTIVVNSINDAPVAVDDSAATEEDVAITIPVLANDSDVESDGLTLIDVSDGVVSGGTHLVYTPPLNFFGTNVVQYYVSDGSATSTGQVTIVVNSVNDAPVAVDDSAVTFEDIEVTVPVLVNDTDVEGDLLSLTDAFTSNGTASVNGTNVVYTPLTGFVGNAVINYLVSDGSATSTGQIAVAVAGMADLSMTLSGPTNGVTGLPMTFVLTVVNNGPSTASNVVARKILPTNQVFGVISPRGILTNNLVEWPVLAALEPGAATNLTIVVAAENPGEYTHSAMASSSTFDPNPANNNTTSGLARISLEIFAADYDLIESPIAMNPQTGLFEQWVTVSNTMPVAVPGFLLMVDGLRDGVSLYNATGVTNGTPYVRLDTALNSGAVTTLLLEYHAPDWHPFSSALSVVWVLASDGATVPGEGISIGAAFMDVRLADTERFVMEFETVPGETYTVLYSDDMVSWRAARPPIVASSTRSQWYDDGPPKTRSHPRSTTNRFYKVIQSH